MVGRTDTNGAYLWDAATSSWTQLVTASSMPAAPRVLALQWDDPPRWQRRVPSTPMRAVEYRVPPLGGDRENGECFVTTFGPGQGGTVDDNIAASVRYMRDTLHVKLPPVPEKGLFTEA